MARRKKYTPEFKAKVVMELIEGDDSLSAVASRRGISPSMLSDWRRQLVDNASAVFSRRHVRALMEHMGIRSTAPQPKTSAPAKHRPRFPYLLRGGKRIMFPNQVWSTDITYVPLGRGHVYLSAVIDWHSRYIVGWRLHDTLEARECVACMERAFPEHGTPSVCNSDQGSTYTASEHVACLKSRGVGQSMDGKGRWADNVYIERWFRNLKHDCLYLSDYSTFGEPRRLIAAYVDKYNERRPHTSLGGSTPAEWYYSGLNERREPHLTLAA